MNRYDSSIKESSNWWFLFLQGWNLISLPMTVYVFATNIYYMSLRELPNAPIPPFIIFIVALGAIGLPLCIGLGYAFTKSPLYRGNFNVTTLRNPYAQVYYQALLEQNRLLYRLTGEPENAVLMRNLEDVVKAYDESGHSSVDAKQ